MLTALSSPSHNHNRYVHPKKRDKGSKTHSPATTQCQSLYPNRTHRRNPFTTLRYHTINSATKAPPRKSWIKTNHRNTTRTSTTTRRSTTPVGSPKLTLSPSIVEPTTYPRLHWRWSHAKLPASHYQGQSTRRPTMILILLQKVQPRSEEED